MAKIKWSVGVKETHSTDQFDEYCHEIESTAAWGGLLEVRAMLN